MKASKPKPLSLAGTAILVLLCALVQAQSIGTLASAVWITDCSQSNFFNTSGNAANLIGPSANVFDGASLGVHTQNSGTLILRGAQIKSFKDPLTSNVCSAQLYYRIYLQSGIPGAFTAISLPLFEDCGGGGTYPSGGTCSAADQKWQRVIPDGTSLPFAPVNLTTLAPGNYVLEVYYDISGSNTTTTQCNEVVTLNNSGNNYKASFSIQSPYLSLSTNPTTCNGTDGSITISGLAGGASYQLSYTDDGTTVGPASFTANPGGQIVISGLNAGLYSNFILTANGCTTNLFTGTILSNPIFQSTFAAIPAFCAGTTAPVLPTVSSNGVSGTWSPAVIDNQNTGTYTFTPNANSCGLPTTINVTVIPRAVPTFTFGTSLTICESGTVPILPNMSLNGITGTWNPAVVDPLNSGTYVFTPNAGQCATGTTFNVTVNPNITPTFSFGTSLSVCSGAAVPTLPNTSANGITGSWSPAIVDNQNSATYTFTPGAGQCAIPASFTVTVNPLVTPTFAIGSSLTICAGDAVPFLPTVSSNGIGGTWSPAVINNQNSGTYTFTPNANTCGLPVTFNVTVTQPAIPTFTFGTALTICESGTVPILPNSSTNSITGTWSPAVVDPLNSGTYVFTPNAGQCATGTTFNVTVNPNITPTFSFGTSLSVCSGAAVPTLPNTSANGITGTWNPAIVDNQNSGTYTFTPTAGQCAIPGSFTVTVNPVVTPTFGIGSSLTICAGDAVPVLPTVSGNGVTGTWSPSVVNNQQSGTYVFTGTGGPCIAQVTFTVNVNPIITPAFPFGTSQSVCIGSTPPVLQTVSTNGITGTWSPATVDNQVTATYTFTPAAGQCANSFNFTYEVNPIPSLGGIRTDTSVYDGAQLPSYSFVSTPGSDVRWTNSNPAIGLPASGTGIVPSFTAVNRTDNPVTGTITATPFINGCNGASQTYIITVLPLNKDIFVPNAFSPNDDGKNDKLFVYGNYIDKVEMRIFNQWGQQIAMIGNKTQGWDGRQNGTPQPVGVYVYVLKATLTDGRNVSMKGSVTLVR